MTFLLALLPAFLVMGLIAGSGSDADDLDMMAGEGGPDGQGAGLPPTAGDLMDTAFATPQEASAPWDQMEEAPAALFGSDMVQTDPDDAESGSPTLLRDFDTGTEAIEIVLADGPDEGLLEVGTSEDGTGATITLDGVPVVTLEGVEPGSVDLSRVTITREA